MSIRALPLPPFATGTEVHVGPLQRIVVRDGEVAVLRRAHGAPQVLEPGRHRAPFERDLRVQRVPTFVRFDLLPLQEVPTADGITVRASVALLTRITDPVVHVEAGPQVDQFVYLAAQVGLRELVASLDYEDLLTARGALGEQLAEAIGPLDEVGREVIRTEVRDLVLPAELRRAQAAVLVARAEGQAALERARGETAALRSLANAARIAGEHPALLQLRMLQQLDGSAGHTVVLTTGTTS